jgi:hypothetical protein
MMHSKMREPINGFKDASLKIDFSNPDASAANNPKASLDVHGVNVELGQSQKKCNGEGRGDSDPDEFPSSAMEASKLSAFMAAFDNKTFDNKSHDHTGNTLKDAEKSSSTNERDGSPEANGEVSKKEDQSSNANSVNTDGHNSPNSDGKLTPDEIRDLEVVIPQKNSKDTIPGPTAKASACEDYYTYFSQGFPSWDDV